MANLHRETHSELDGGPAGRPVARSAKQGTGTEETMNHDLVNVLVVKVKQRHTSWPYFTAGILRDQTDPVPRVLCDSPMISSEALLRSVTRALRVECVGQSDANVDGPC